MKTVITCCGREIPIKNGIGKCSKCGATVNMKVNKPEPRSTRKKGVQRTATPLETLLYGVGFGVILTIIAIANILGR